MAPACVILWLGIRSENSAPVGRARPASGWGGREGPGAGAAEPSKGAVAEPPPALALRRLKPLEHVEKG